MYRKGLRDLLYERLQCDGTLFMTARLVNPVFVPKAFFK